MSPIVEIILQLLGGAVGGNVVGGLLKKLSLGPIGNSIVGMIGGFVANWLAARYLGALPTSTPPPAAVPGGFQDVLSNLLIGLGGGGVLTGVLGAVRSMMGSK
ncbi:MAG: hypothetical protein F9K44_11730 [Hyphomicrobiaceae bacterium]|nr:MAG: hypothetical protein F9K44_11730 [Hyphomicrobiaceae bacterium]